MLNWKENNVVFVVAFKTASGFENEQLYLVLGQLQLSKMGF